MRLAPFVRVSERMVLGSRYFRDPRIKSPSFAMAAGAASPLIELMNLMVEHYELLYIIPGTKTEEEAKSLTERIHAVLKQHGATVGKTDFWGKRKLAYEINHIRQGYYDLIEFDLDRGSLAALEHDLRLNEHILRYQVVRRHVLSAEALAKNEALRQRIAATRQAEKERLQAASLVAEQAPVAPAPVATKPVAPEELEQKLEEILDSEKVEV